MAAVTCVSRCFPLVYDKEVFRAHQPPILSSLAKFYVTSSGSPSITLCMKDRIERPGAGEVPEPAAASFGSPPARLTGRAIFCLPEGRVRGDGGPVFDTVEIAPVAVVDSEGSCEAFESLDDVPEEIRSSVFWSLYGHTPGEGVQCLGDFRSSEDALEALVRLFGDLPAS